MADDSFKALKDFAGFSDADVGTAGSTRFGLSLLGDKRANIERQRRRQKKEERKDWWKDLLREGALETAQWSVEEKAEEAEKKGYAAKVNYNNTLARAESIRAGRKARLEAKQTPLQYITEQYRAALTEQFQKNFPEISMVGINTLIQEEALKLAEKSVGKYTDLENKAMQGPNIKTIDEDYKKYADIPEDIGSFVLESVKDWWEGDSEETINIRTKKATDALYNTELGDTLKSMRTSIDAYDLVTSEGYKLIDIIKKAKKQGLWKGNVISDGIKIVTDEVLSPDKTTIQSTTSVIAITQDPNTGGIMVDPKHNKIVVSTTEQPNDGAYLTATEVSNLLEMVDLDTFPKAYNTVKTMLTPKKGEVRPLYSAQLEVLNYLLENENYRSKDWQDIKAQTDAFTGWYSSKIQNVTVENARGQEVPIGIWNPTDKMWEINPDYVTEAKKRGLDEISQRALFRKQGHLLDTPVYNSREEYENITALKNAGYKFLPDLIAPTGTSLYNKQEDLYIDWKKNILPPMIKGKEKEDIIFLTDYSSQEIEAMFGISGVENSRMYWNNETSQLFYKPN